MFRQILINSLTIMSDEQNLIQSNLEYDFDAQQRERTIKRRRLAKKLARMRYKPLYRLQWLYELRSRNVKKKVIDHYFCLMSQRYQEFEAKQGLEEWYKKNHSTMYLNLILEIVC